MAKSYMQMIYIDSEDQARHTDCSAAQASNALTWEAFQSYRRFEVSREAAQFLLDYYNAKGDLADTIRLDAAGFTAITGQPVKTDAEYCQIDAEYWAAVVAERKTA